MKYRIICAIIAFTYTIIPGMTSFKIIGSEAFSRYYFSKHYGKEFNITSCSSPSFINTLSNVLETYATYLIVSTSFSSTRRLNIDISMNGFGPDRFSTSLGRGLTCRTVGK